MKVAKRGEPVPVGFSWRDSGEYACRNRLQLRLPVFIWHGKHYDVCNDSECYGWRALNVLVKSSHQGFEFRWGWAMVKQTRPSVRLSVSGR